jgi:5-hydroxyisourate hydrolase-like protein (transthyretin family)
MSRNIPVALIVLVLAGLTAFILWPNENSDSFAGVKRNRSEVGEGQLTEAMSTETRESTEPNPGRVLNNASSSGGTTSKIEAPYAGEDAITLILVDDSTELPIADADLYLLSRDQVPMPGWMSIPSNLNPLLRSMGTHYRANERGEIRIKRPIEFPTALAEEGRRFMLVKALSVEGDSMQLRLRRNQKLNVLVVNATEDPVAGVMVELHSGKTSNWWATSAKVHTNAEGIAVFEDMVTQMKHGRATGSLYAALSMPMKLADLVDHGRIEITPQILAAGQAKLRLPATGQVRITILNSKGDLEDSPGTVHLQSAPESNSSFSGTESQNESVDGQAVFPLVPLKTPLKASFIGDGARNTDFILFDGPTAENPEVEISLQRLVRDTISGRILDSAGQPLVNQMIRLRDQFATDEAFEDRLGQFETDANGRFQYEIVEASWLEEGRYLSHRLIFSSTLKEQERYEGIHELNLGTSAGNYELGDLILTRIPALLAGKVIDLDSKAIPNVQISLQYSKDPEAERPQWDWIRKGHGFTDKEGRFHIYGTMSKPTTYRATIRAQGYEDLAQEITLGNLDQVFQLSKAPVLLGKVLLDEGVTYSDLWISFEDGHGSGHPQHVPTAEPGAVDFRFEGKIGSSYALKVMSTFREVLYQSDGLTLQRGSETRPPALQPLDLRGKLKAFQIEVKNGSGVALNATAAIQLERLSTSRKGSLGVIQVVSAGPLDLVEVSAKGYVSKTLERVHSNQVVILEPALEVTIQLPMEFLHYRNCRLSLNPNDPPSRISSFSELQHTPFDEDGQAKLFVPGIGEYRIGLFFHPLFGPPSLRSRGFGISLASYNISANGQIINFKVDKEEFDGRLDKVIAEMEGDGSD